MDDDGIYMYMCSTDFDYEMGYATDTSFGLYSTVESLKRFKPCVETCGITRVKVVFDRVEQEPNYFDE